MMCLYKGRRVDGQGWIKGDVLVDDITGQVFINAMGNSVNESMRVGEEGSLHFVAFEVEPETVGQFIGKNDVEGEPIFEGDILVSESSKPYKAYEVKFEKENARYVGVYTKGSVCHKIEFSQHSSVRKVGNMHENPEIMDVYNK